LKGTIISVRLPNGSLVYIASGYGASKSMTVLTNAAEAVATLEASHGVVENDYLEVTSGWSRLTNKIVRADSVNVNDVTFEDIDTSSTTIYSAGTGIGSVREISGWTQITQILAPSSSGGEQRYLAYQFLEADAETEIPTVKSAGGLQFNVGDDPTLAGYIALNAANDDRLQHAFKVVLPSGAILLYNAYVSLNKTPTLSVNELMVCTASLRFLAEPMRYAS
jgi:hypothetical protein